MYSTLSEKIDGDFKSLDRKYSGHNRKYGITIGVHAPHRQGKTLTVIMLVLRYLINLPYIKGVISNVDLDLSSVNMKDKFIPLVEIKNIKKEEYKDYIIVTDELRRILDSRMSSSFKNRFLSNILSDTGKFRQIHLFTDQDGGAVDKRVRVNTDTILRPFIDLKNGVCCVKVFDKYSTYFWTEANDLFDNYNVEFFYPIEKYYQFYDTEQPIDDYYIAFTPKELANVFIDWLDDMGYSSLKDLTIKKSTITLWSELNPELHITDSQKTALYEYIRLESAMERLKYGQDK